MAILFISDLHLSEHEPHITQLFLYFLQYQAREAEALYILGDLFEAWAGDDDLNPHNQSIIKALKQLSDTGVTIYFMHGNRDFLIEKRFAEASGCKLIADPCIINLYGTATLLMHGDTLCTRDITYLKFRKRARHPLTKWLFLLIPLMIRLKLVKRIRGISKSQGKKLAQEITDVTPAEIPIIMTQHQVQLLIHGHTHRPALHLFTMEDKFVSRIVLSDWVEQGNVLICSSDGTRKLVYFDTTNRFTGLIY
ncbi:UDP-2,3-diacylglucosamine diphosphatase [soil metagenome]